MRILLLSFFLFIFGHGAIAQNFDDMAPDQRAAFGAAVRAYLLENPEVVMEAVAILQSREQAAAVEADRDLAARYTDVLENDGYSYIGGNPEGTITLVEFLDYRCGYCRRAHAEVAALVATNTDIRYIVKEFPVLGDESVLAARAALAVLVNDGPEIYREMNGLLMTFDGPFTDETLLELAGQAGADAARMADVMNAPLITEMIASNRALAQRLQVSGTPTFVLAGQMIRGYVPAEVMNSLVEDAREAIN